MGERLFPKVFNHATNDEKSTGRKGGHSATERPRNVETRRKRILSKVFHQGNAKAAARIVLGRNSERAFRNKKGIGTIIAGQQGNVSEFFYEFSNIFKEPSEFFVVTATTNK